MARSRRSVDEALGAALAAPAVPATGPVAIAWSGGLDSTVLLDAAVRTLGAGRVLALHVHHGLQPAAEDWLNHCRDRAAAIGAGFRALRAIGAPRPGDSIEQWARGERYRLLLAAARDARAACLLTAHHADDQVETVLLALGRGCGLDGLTGIAREDRRDGVRLLRPLLEFDRAELLETARARGLAWVEDPSNADPRFARNAVRARLLPVLREVLPNLARHLPGTLELLREARGSLDAIAGDDLRAARAAIPAGSAPEWQEGDDRLDRRAVAALPDARRAALLRAWASGDGTPPPSRAKLAELLAQLVDGPGPHAEVRHGGRLLRRHRDLLWAVPARSTEPPGPVSLCWRGEPELAAGGWGRFAFATVGCGLDPAWLRGRSLHVEPVPAAARLRLHPGGPARTLKNLRQEAGIPSPLRSHLPGLWVDRMLLFAAPFGQDRGKDWPLASPGIELAWRR